MTKQQGIGTYLAQGWTVNAMALYLWMLGYFLFKPEGKVWIVLALVAPIYCFIIGCVGAAVAVLVWIVEFATERRISMICRGIGAVLLPILLVLIVAVMGGFLSEFTTLLWSALSLIVLALPSALISGVRFNPLRFLVLDLRREVPVPGWGRALTVIAVPLLRIVSVLGLLEAFLYLSCLRSPELGSWPIAEEQFVGAVVAVIYFAITLIVALCLPHRILAIGIGIIANAPVVAFAVYARSHPNGLFQFLAVFGWIVVLLWALFVFSRLILKVNRRLMPLTMLEIRIRHALNYW